VVLCRTCVIVAVNHSATSLTFVLTSTRPTLDVVPPCTPARGVAASSPAPVICHHTSEPTPETGHLRVTLAANSSHRAAASTFTDARTSSRSRSLAVSVARDLPANSTLRNTTPCVIRPTPLCCLPDLPVSLVQYFQGSCRSARPTQPGHASTGRQNEYYWR